MTFSRQPRHTVYGPNGSFYKQLQPTLAEHRELKKRRKKNLDTKEKERVRQRDKELCRVCSRKTRHVHERLFKSLGGLASVDNSLCACLKCHPLLQGHAIRPLGRTCNGPLVFQMTKQTAYLIFRNRPTPSQVEIVEKVLRDDEARGAVA
jgi:hypothetical protein